MSLPVSMAEGTLPLPLGKSSQCVPATAPARSGKVISVLPWIVLCILYFLSDVLLKANSAEAGA